MTSAQESRHAVPLKKYVHARRWNRFAGYGYGHFGHGAETYTDSVNRTGAATGNWSCYFPSVSADGRFVVFQSNSNDLVMNDNAGVDDAFVRDMQTSVTSLISINQAGANCVSVRS